MEPSGLCCRLFIALSLDPVPVIEGTLYISGAEGLRLSDIGEGSMVPCPEHRFNYWHTITLLKQCSSTSSCGSEQSERQNVRVCPFMWQSQCAKCADAGKKCVPLIHNSGPSNNLWAEELDTVVTAYAWLLKNRNRMYPKCSEAVIVLQLRKSQSLPAGLYVYRTRPQHFGCTLEGPVTILDQFNFICTPVPRQEAIPDAIIIDMFPGRDNFSSIYVIEREQIGLTPEYGNRIFGEAMAMGLIQAYSDSGIRATPCKFQDIALRTEAACVVDLRWKGFDTKTSCIASVPKLRGLLGLVWSNHIDDYQETEQSVLLWVFGFSTKLPKQVHMVDYKSEVLGVRYIIMETDTYPGPMPSPPCRNSSYFIHTYFIGDLKLAHNAIGCVPESRSRMGTPCQISTGTSAFWYSLTECTPCLPTPFSCGVKCDHTVQPMDEVMTSLINWTLEQDGASCLALAVQHTLYYVAWERKYKIMITHTVMDCDKSLHIFKL